jgi:fucose 4-O-acetylase-like acetyltransferase
MTTVAAPRASDLARNTPASRDRYVDFLRLVSIIVVVLGHWLMAAVTWHGSTFHVGNVVEMTPGLWLATWVFQVMPIFFFVGGFSNFVTLDTLERKHEGAAEFIEQRVARLLRPVALLFAIWVPAALALQWAGFDARVLASATRLVCQPLWFIGVYLGITALAPCMRGLHRLHRAATLGALIALAMVVDLARFGVGADAIGYFNVLFVWLLAQQLGFFYADGSLARLRPSRLLAIAGGALASLAALVMFGPYPLSMVGLPGDRISNMSPPTLCLAALTVFQVAVAMLLRPAMQQQLARHRLWTAVVAGNGVIMTIYLWHLTAALLALAALHWTGILQATPATAQWWATRPVWIACALAPLGAAVAGLGRFERPHSAAASNDRSVLRHASDRDRALIAAGTGAALLAIAMLGVASSSIVDLAANVPVQLAVVTLTPVELLVGAAVGVALVHRGRSRSTAAGS